MVRVWLKHCLRYLLVPMYDIVLKDESFEHRRSWQLLAVVSLTLLCMCVSAVLCSCVF